MHQQIKSSPETTRENVWAVVNALAAAGINIEAIAPDFDPPHVRVLVKHNHPYDPNDPDDAFNRALAALVDAHMEPTVERSIELIQIPNEPAALQRAMEAIDGEDVTIASILVLPGAQDDKAVISFGVEGDTPDEAWAARSEELRAIVQNAVDNP
jgi:hypothetical protein